MASLGNNFHLDKRNSKFMGVCAGIADYTGWDVTLVRIGTILGTVLAWGGLILVYFLIAWLAQPKPFA